MSNPGTLDNEVPTKMTHFRSRRTAADWKAFYIAKIMWELDKIYMAGSSVYLSTTNGLSKMSVNELSSLWAMIITIG